MIGAWWSLFAFGKAFAFASQVVAERYNVLPDYNEQMHCDVCQAWDNVEIADIVPCIFVWQKVREAHQEVVDEQNCQLIKRFDIVCEIGSQWFKVLQEDNHAKVNEVLGGKLRPDQILQLHPDEDKD